MSQWQKFGDEPIHGVYWIAGTRPEIDSDVDAYGQPVGWHTGRSVPFVALAYVDFDPDDPDGPRIEICDVNQDLPGCTRLDNEEVIPTWVMPAAPPRAPEPSDTSEVLEEMGDEIKALFSQSQVIRNVIVVARKIVGKREASQRALDAAEKALGLALFYAPDDLRPMVEATLHEFGIRRAMAGSLSYAEPG